VNRFPLIAALLAGFLAWSAAAPPLVVDDLGRSVALPAPPQRIVSLVPSHTETVCALGACDLLVGRDTWSDYPPSVRALPDLGSAFAPNLEALVALAPDLVLVDEYSGAADAIAALGLIVYAGTPQSLADLHDTFWRLGTLLSAESAAQRLADAWDDARATIAARIADRDRPSVYLELDPSPYSAGPGTLLGALLSAAGGMNVVGVDDGDFPLLTPEFVLRSDPDVILLMHPDAGAGFAARPGWTDLSAVRAGRVVVLDAATIDALSRPGPRTVLALERLAALLHPEVF
jgi:iron complex transport system substrate-binding protein